MTSPNNLHEIEGELRTLALIFTYILLCYVIIDVVIRQTKTNTNRQLNLKILDLKINGVHTKSTAVYKIAMEVLYPVGEMRKWLKPAMSRLFKICAGDKKKRGKGKIHARNRIRSSHDINTHSQKRGNDGSQIRSELIALHMPKSSVQMVLSRMNSPLSVRRAWQFSGPVCLGWVKVLDGKS